MRLGVQPADWGRASIGRAGDGAVATWKQGQAPARQQGGMTLSSKRAGSMAYRVNITYSRVPRCDEGSRRTWVPGLLGSVTAFYRAVLEGVGRGEKRQLPACPSARQRQSPDFNMLPDPAAWPLDRWDRGRLNPPQPASRLSCGLRGESTAYDLTSSLTWLSRGMWWCASMDSSDSASPEVPGPPCWAANTCFGYFARWTPPASPLCMPISYIPR